MRWTGPSLRNALTQAAREKAACVGLIPISFVCENLETLYELDIEYAGLAKQCGIRTLWRAPTPAAHPAFLAGLADLVHGAMATES